jgi:hypothetical protein
VMIEKSNLWVIFNNIRKSSLKRDDGWTVAGVGQSSGITARWVPWVTGAPCTEHRPVFHHPCFFFPPVPPVLPSSSPSIYLMGEPRAGVKDGVGVYTPPCRTLVWLLWINMSLSVYKSAQTASNCSLSWSPVFWGTAYLDVQEPR